MPSKEQIYNAKLSALLKDADNLSSSSVKRIADILQKAQKETAALIATTEWQAFRIPQYQAALDRIFAEVAKEYSDYFRKALSDSYFAGADMIDLPLASIGIKFVAPDIALSTLQILQGYSADLITNLSAQAIQQINGEIIQGILGGKTPFKVMQAIGRNLTSPSVFASIMTRAETITRTEMARVYSLSSQARMESFLKTDIAKTIEWNKKWIASGAKKPRKWHKRLHGVTIPIKQNFQGLKQPIPYPHAPGLPAFEVINCGCVHVLDTNWDKLAG